MYITNAVQEGWSPLINAAERGHVKLAEVLLEKGASVDLTGPVRGYWSMGKEYKFKISK